FHRLVDGKNLHGAGAYAKKTGQSAGAKHKSPASRNMLHVVTSRTVRVRETAVQAQPGSKWIVWNFAFSLRSRFPGKVCGKQQHHSKDNCNCMCRYSCRKVCAEKCTQGGRNLEEHTDSDIREALFHVSCRRARGSRDHRNERSADGIADVHLEEQAEQRYEDNASAQPS